MKEAKYPLFGQWLKKARGSYSLQSVGKLIGKKHNTVSNYEKGYVKPPKLIVAFLINLYNGNPLEIADFLQYDLMDIQDLSNLLNVSGQSVTYFKNECWNKLNCARKFREIDSPHNALKMINACAYSLETRIRAEIDSLKDIQDYKYMLLLTHGEKIGCTTVLLPRYRVMSEIFPIYSRMNKLSIDIEERYRKLFLFSSPTDSFKAVDCNSPTFSGLAYSDCCMAAAYFVAKNYDEAIRYQKKAIPLCGFDKNLLAETYRGLILSLAHTQIVEEVNKVEIKINNLLGKEISDPVNIDSLRCAIAEARMLVGRDGSREKLAEVESSIFNTNKFMPLKIIQFYKTQLFLAINDQRMNRRINVEMMQEVIRKGTSLAQLYGYERHAREIALLGKMIEGKKRVESRIYVKTPDYRFK